jgi:hypothetical protein
MRRIVLYAVVPLLLIVGGGAYWLYSASQDVPEFYSVALQIAPEAADAAGDEFSQNAVALAGDVHEEGDWTAYFTDEQINGFLAADLPEKHPNLLPPEFTDPRVRILDDRAQIGIRCKIGGVSTVAWIDVSVSMTEAYEAAVRFRRVRAGSLPLPQSEVLDAVSQVAADLGMVLRWTTVEGDPTAIMALPPLDERGLRYELTRLKLATGKLFIAGRTLRENAKRDGAHPGRYAAPNNQDDVARLPESNQAPAESPSVKKR